MGCLSNRIHFVTFVESEVQSQNILPCLAFYEASHGCADVLFLSVASHNLSSVHAHMWYLLGSPHSCLELAKHPS